MSAHGLLHGSGTPEADWRPWLAATTLPQHRARDLVPAHARLVVLAPHPDDELLACGGLLASHAANNGQAWVVGVTDGEASHANTPAWHAAPLAQARRQERLQGLRRLTPSAVTVLRLGLPDGQVALHAATLLRTLTALLRPGDVVVSPWRLDGHPDHDCTGACAAQACLAVPCRLLEAPVWMWHWAAPDDARVPWHRLVAVPLDAATVARKQHALAAHTTQIRPRGNQGAVLGPAMLERAARCAEYYLV